MRAIAESGVYDQAAHQVDHWNDLESWIGRAVVRIHVFEFIGGGGLAGARVRDQLAREGDLMLAALVADLLEMPDVQVSFARDARRALPADPRLRGAQVCWREPQATPSQALADEIAAADATWPIAPETGGELERAARAVIDDGRILLGPRPGAIPLASCTSVIARHLQTAVLVGAQCHLHKYALRCSLHSRL